jgi:hypothetical protein
MLPENLIIFPNSKPFTIFLLGKSSAHPKPDVSGKITEKLERNQPEKPVEQLIHSRAHNRDGHPPCLQPFLDSRNHSLGGQVAPILNLNIVHINEHNNKAIKPKDCHEHEIPYHEELDIVSRLLDIIFGRIDLSAVPQNFVLLQKRNSAIGDEITNANHKLQQDRQPQQRGQLAHRNYN